MDLATVSQLVEIISRLDRQTVENIVQACRTRLSRIGDEKLRVFLGDIERACEQEAS